MYYYQPPQNVQYPMSATNNKHTPIVGMQYHQQLNGYKNQYMPPPGDDFGFQQQQIMTGEEVIEDYPTEETEAMIPTETEQSQAYLLQSESEVIPQGDYTLLRTTIYDMPFVIPEWSLKQTTCDGSMTGWCPQTPWKTCTWRWTYPCWKNLRRESRYRFVLEVRIPSRVAGSFEEQLKKCNDNAKRIAVDIVKQSAISGALGAITAGIPIQAPLAGLQAAIKAIPVAIKWYVEMMVQCLNGIMEGLGDNLVNALRAARIRSIKTSTNWH